MLACMYVCVYVYVYVYAYAYIYNGLLTKVSLKNETYRNYDIYVYIYIYRERDIMRYQDVIET